MRDTPPSVARRLRDHRTATVRSRAMGEIRGWPVVVKRLEASVGSVMRITIDMHEELATDFVAALEDGTEMLLVENKEHI